MESGIRALLLAALVSAGTASGQILVSDGFGDGDRDNDGVADGPVTDAGDVGQAWYLARGTSSITIGVADDSAGIGTGNAFDLSMMDTSSTRIVASTFASTTLNDGDRILMRLDARITESPIDPVATDLSGNGDRRFRMGLYNGMGTDLTADTGDSTTTNDDTGYMIQVDTGTADGGTTITGRGDPAPSMLSGSTVSMGASDSDPMFAMMNTTSTFEYVIQRIGDDLSFSVVVNGILAQDGDIAAADLTANGLTYDFDTVAFGMSGGSVDFRADNIEVIYVPAPTGTASTDGFEDGDRDNDLLAEGPVNDPADVGFVWYKARGESGLLVDVVDDAAGHGTGNAFSGLISTSSTRAMIAAIDEVALADGDSIAFEFDVRFDGFVPDTDRRFRFGLYHSAGTPIVEDTGSSATTDDDPGYMVQMDTGVPTPMQDTATIRRDLIGGMLSGSTGSFGASTDDPSLSIGTASKNVRLELERAGSEMNTRLIIDGSLAASGTDTTPDTFVFDEIVFGTNSVSLGSYLVDNVEVEVFQTVDCACDVNGDTVCSPADFTAWLAAFNSTSPECDVNGDGMCSPADFTAWLAAFNVGCP